MFSRKTFALVFLLGCGGGVAIACGPGFPWQLLDNRKQTMETLPDNDFAFEVAHLVPPPADAPPAIGPEAHKIASGFWDRSESEFPDRDNAPIEQRRANAERMSAEAGRLTQEQQASVHQMRAAESYGAAAAINANLPGDVRAYTLGAIAFRAKDYATAIIDFQGAIAATNGQPMLHGTWARYMLARAEAASGDSDGAAKEYAALRKVMAAGAPDPLGLGIASYGEEGRSAIERINAVTKTKAPGWQKMRGELLQQAIRLYATQTALDPSQGVESLLVVADEIMYNPADLDATIDDDITRRLLTAYGLSRWSGSTNITLDGQYRTIGAFDRTLLPELPRRFDSIGNFLQTIDQHHIATVEGSDRIAALAYRDGHYDLAAGFAAKSETPLAYWVRAKLAVRDGKREEAAPLYAHAVEGLAADPGALDKDFGRRLRGERAVLSISHQDYLVALGQLYPDATTYWGDVAYLAERIVTVDELKNFVDAQATGVKDDAKNKVYYDGTPENSAQSLRELLARRLTREDRIPEALPYFSSANKLSAEAYAKAIAAEKTSSGIARAATLHELAQRERQDGMELLGYEAAPDFEAEGGTFDFGLGQTSVYGRLPEMKKPLPSEADAFTSADEAQRLAKTKANPDLRYHYRYIAAAHEAEAAGLVPQRSQAYAALLCAATHDVQSLSPDIAQTYYRQYLKHGAFVPWAQDFGNDCPAPNFGVAKTFHMRQLGRHLYRLEAHKLGLAGAGAAAAAMIVAFFYRKRRKVA